MEELNKILINEISRFRESGHDFSDWKISKMDFKGISINEVCDMMKEGIRNLNGSEAEKLLKDTEHIGGTMRLEYSTACIGIPTCQIGVLNKFRK